VTVEPTAEAQEAGRLAAALRVLADLAPTGSQVALDVRRSSAFAWLGEVDAARLLGAGEGTAELPVRPSRALRTLQGLDALHAEERLIRAGWGFLTGTVVDGDQRRTVLVPLLSCPVRIRGRAGRARIVAAGDTEATPLVDAAHAQHLEMAGPFALTGGPGDDAALRSWLLATARTTGFAVAALLPAATDPTRRRRTFEPGDGAGREEAGLSLVPGVGIYAARDVAATDVASTLRGWASVEGLGDTAFGALYGARPSDGRMPDDVAMTQAEGRLAEELRSPLPLTEAQREVVARARREVITVVSGAPGNGKSHALVATAIDAVARGCSVLVATQSIHAAEVLGELLARYPGPQPVAFGSSEQREAIAVRFAAGLPPEPTGEERRSVRTQVEEAARRHEVVHQAIGGLLERERLAALAPGYDGIVPALTADAPDLFAPDSDHGEITDLLARVQRPDDRWWARLRRRRAERALRRRTGAAGRVSLERIELAVRVAQARRVAAELLTAGGTQVGRLWDDLLHAEEALAERVGEEIQLRANAVPASARPAVASLAAALRAGRARRRELLARMDGSELVGALPLWVGTLRDVEDLLPRTPGLFDLVILDEASQIDQLRAAPTLLRGRRAVVAGDPRQLRHVSFVADADVAQRLEAHGATALADRLDVRRMSALDVAAAVGATTWLDEHFRSVPHLIAFSAERFYPQPIRLVTLHPRNESADVDRRGARRRAPRRGRRQHREVDAVADSCETSAVDRIERRGGEPLPSAG
jgi:hypothetical protein